MMRKGTGQSMGVAALIMGASVLVSRFMGLIRDKVISYHYGASMESDIYFASFVIPDFINYLLAGAYFSITLIPLLTEAFERNEQDGWQLMGCVFSWMLVASIPVTGAAMYYAPELARLAAPGFDPEASARLAYFLRIILPAQIFFLAGSCILALVYMRKAFTIPAFVPLVYNGMIIAFGLAMIDHGMEGFCWGVFAGSVLGNFLLPVWAAVRSGGLRMHFTLRHRDLKRFVLMALPLMVGQSIVILDEQLLRIFGSLLREGAVSWLNYARRIMLVPVGVVAQAAGVASYPYLAELAARKETGRFDQTVNTALVSAMSLIIPMAVWMAVHARSIIALIFQQGGFQAGDTEVTALCLQVMLLATGLWVLQQLLGRAFYSRKDTLTPTILGTVALAVGIPVFIHLGRLWDAPGVALASVASMAVYCLLLVVVWSRRFGTACFHRLPRAALVSAAMSGAALFPALAARAVASFLWPGQGLLDVLFSLACSGLAFSTAYYLLAAWLSPRLVEPVTRRLQKLRGTR